MAGKTGLEMNNTHSTGVIQPLAESLFQSSQFETRLLKGDGSDRKIYRLQPFDSDLKSVIAVHHENLEENRDFLKLTAYLRDKNIPVPEIYLISKNQTSYLLQDLGPHTLADKIEIWRKSNQPQKIVAAYQSSLNYLSQMQNLSWQSDQGDILDKQMGTVTYLEDLIYFEDSFIKAFDYGDLLSNSVKKELRQELVDKLGEVDHGVFVYRDFQSRNIMWQDDTPWFIDYQSAMRGPLYYDLASLLYSSRSGISAAEREALCNYYYKMLAPSISIADFQGHFFRFVLIRRLRSLGTYGYLSLVKDKKQFRKAIPSTLTELNDLLSNQECLQSFGALGEMIRKIADLIETT